MTAIRSDSSRTSSSSAETSRIAVPASRISIDLAVDELDAADIQAARRLVEHQELRVALNSRATTAFCWFPPDSVPAVTSATVSGCRIAR